MTQRTRKHATRGRVEGCRLPSVNLYVKHADKGGRMTRYEPKDHIQHLEVAPRAETLLDQREITIQSYQTTIPFNYDAIDAGIENAWLTPQIRFGVFSRARSTDDKDAFNVVLGLQDALAIRAYDYDARRPLWYSWQDAIVDTINIHYYRDEDGLLRFTATGGGRRITDEKLHEFNSSFLGIPAVAVSKRHFDLDKLRDMCFTRFFSRLYVVRFSDPSGEEYRSIDHAQFQSREYIDPLAERLQEIRTDPQVKIESFDSDIEVLNDDLASPVRVRFFIRGLSGSLRLRFPTMSYKSQLKTVQEQTRVAYRIVDTTVSLILDADYYTQQRRSLDELDKNITMFPDMVDLAQFRDVLISATAREQFLKSMNVGGPWQDWQPHLRAINELIVSDVVHAHVTDLVDALAHDDPQRATRLLTVCIDDAKVLGVGAIAANALATHLQTIPAAVRGQAEEALLAWSLAHEKDTWQVAPDAGTVGVLAVLRWRVQDLSLGVLPKVLWKLVGLLHDRLLAGAGDTGLLLRQFHWCVEIAKTIPPQQPDLKAALRLVVENKVPRTLGEAAAVLKAPVETLRALDDAVLDQFGLPLWPHLEASRQDGKVVLSNSGVGAALSLMVSPTGMLFAVGGSGTPVDLPCGKNVSMPAAQDTASVDARFQKFGKEYCIAVPVAEERPPVQQGDATPISPDAVADIKAAVAKVGEDVETVKQHVRGVPVLQADLKDARVVPEALALEIQNRIADILTVEQQEIWRAMRSAGGVQTEALPVLQGKKVVNSAATLNRRVKKINQILTKNGLTPCDAKGPATRYQVTGGHTNDRGVSVPVEFSAVEQDWAKDPAGRETTIKAFLAASPEDQEYFKQTKPGIEDEAKIYEKGRR